MNPGAFVTLEFDNVRLEPNQTYCVALLNEVSDRWEVNLSLEITLNKTSALATPSLLLPVEDMEKLVDKLTNSERDLES